MKIQYASDLHLEFPENRKFLQENPLKPVGDVLVLAGDIGYFAEYALYADFWDYVSANFSETIVAIGNHELYTYFDLADISDGLFSTIRPNVKVYYNAVVQIDNVDFIVSTLWSKIPIVDAYLTERSVNDFYRILYKGKRLSYNVFNEEHGRCFDFIRRGVACNAQNTARKTVVMTHHVPSFELSSPDFAGSYINGAFATELGNYIAESKIDYWIYGHSHRNIDKTIGNTKCVSNQLGYISHNENISFVQDKYIEMDIKNEY
ncbi:MAG: metallophosphoesterase [Prevotella sp.]|jgi:predicted phosphodiesterase|nr:metallophosphoesterase [Prevotella sp.]